MRTALVHDWLTGMRGGEKALEQICALYPDADLFTLLHVPGSVSPTVEARRVHTSLVQRLPMARRFYRHYLPLFPLAIEQFTFDPFDLVVSFSHCVAKSVVTPGRTRHLCYCFTPMRYAWDQFDAYFGPERVAKTWGDSLDGFAVMGGELLGPWAAFWIRLALLVDLLDLLDLVLLLFYLK